MIPPSSPLLDNEEFKTVTVFREHKPSDQGIRFLTVVVNLDLEVVNALDEDGVPIALTPEEELFAIRMVRMGVDDTK